MAQANPTEPERQEAEAVDESAEPRRALPEVRKHWSQLARDECIRTYLPDILERHAEGETLTSICRTEGYPSRFAIYRWCHEIDDVAQQFARARELHIEALDDQIIAIADDATEDWCPSAFGPVLNREHVQRSKLRMEAREGKIARVRGIFPGTKAAQAAKPKAAAPTRILVVGIQPRNPLPSGAIEGEAVRVNGHDADDD